MGETSETSETMANNSRPSCGNSEIFGQTVILASQRERIAYSYIQINYTCNIGLCV